MTTLAPELNGPVPEAIREPRVPGATYRLQFNARFTFAQATAIVPYLEKLGLTDCYASPLFKAAPQSTHGYDVCGFDQCNPALGEPQAVEQFTRTLHERGLGLLLDVVPNHMASSPANAWWMDVLEKGPASPYASYFDIDWQPLNSDLHNKVLLPVLGDFYAKVLESGELKLIFQAGAFFIQYYDKEFPLSPESYGPILQEVLAGSPPGAPFQTALREIQQRCRHEPKIEVQAQLRDLHIRAEAFRDALGRALPAWNGTAGSPRSFDKLHALLQQQHFRLAYWRAASDALNYRRFFDVTSLVSVRVELPEVFQACHEFVFRLLAEGKVNGLRIDHPDGLRDPARYFVRLQETFARLNASAEQAGPAPRLYVVVEKILSGDEVLPEDWPVHGTTGYEFLNLLNGIFIASNHREQFDQIYDAFTGCKSDFKALVYESKKKILLRSLWAEIAALANRLKQVCVHTRYGQDFTLRKLQEALTEVIAAFPVYRTYIQENSAAPSATDRQYIHQAIREAQTRNPELEPALLDFLQKLLRLENPGDFDAPTGQRSREFVLRFQQLTGPAMAKGLEDTTFYNYNRLISLNEVGGDPGHFGVSLDDFHRANHYRLQHWPASLLATATHDTKRGEDVRATINVLSEIPEEWRQAATRWHQLNQQHQRIVKGQSVPTANDEYLFYQSLLGAWPPQIRDSGLALSVEPEFRERMLAYMEKALKEAKANTSWTEPNQAYEAGVRDFIRKTLDVSISAPFLQDFVPFQRRLSFFGRLNSLSQVLLKLTCPGVPDVYQGSELWDLSLVDPDNRRPVDFDWRSELLDATRRRWAESLPNPKPFLNELLQQIDTGQIKLFTIHQTLRFRREHQELFARGDYMPLRAEGALHEHVCSFLRKLGDEVALIVAPRLILTLTHDSEIAPLGPDFWKNTFLPIPIARPGNKFQNLLTNETCSVSAPQGQPGLFLGQILGAFPVALLTATP